MPKTMTPAALAANRANAQKSTGPRTPEGKAIVSQNAVTHGLSARALIPPALEPYESREEYEALLTSVRRQLRPATALEHLLVESIAANNWRLLRLYRVEAGLIARRQDAIRRDDAFGMPTPHVGIAQLTAALGATPVDLATLRAIFVIPGAGREGYSDEMIVELAQGTLATLQRQHEEAVARWRQAAELESSLPAPETTHRLGRYGAQLKRQIHTDLHDLRELQAMRASEPEPAAKGGGPATTSAGLQNKAIFGRPASRGWGGCGQSSAPCPAGCRRRARVERPPARAPGAAAPSRRDFQSPATLRSRPDAPTRPKGAP
jgi:hypothetical protein